MSKPVKKLITEEYKSRFEGVTGAVVVDIRGIEANTNNGLRTALAEKQIKITVVKNSLAKQAIEGSRIEGISPILDGPSAMVYPVSDELSVVTVARELLSHAKEISELEFKGAVLDGIVFGPDEIKKLSEYPTKEEAQATVVQLFLTPAQNLVGATQGPGRKIASILKALQDKLEAGEEIKKAS